MWNYDDEEGTEPPTRTDLARADELERRLEELRAAQRRYNQFLDTVVDGKPAPRTTVKTAYRKPLR